MGGGGMRHKEYPWIIFYQKLSLLLRAEGGVGLALSANIVHQVVTIWFALHDFHDEIFHQALNTIM